MRRQLLVFLIVVAAYGAKAQQYALFNTKTLFDSFENPAQKSFVLDSSRQFASNFLLPYMDISSLSKGNSNEAIGSLVRQGYSQTRIGSFANPKTMRENVNIYLAAIRLFKYHKYHSEMGFSWQIKSETQVDYDEKLSRGLFYDTFQQFTTIPRVNIFNNNGKLQTYHQISFTYRENYTKRWALGAKVSLLSGIGYAEFDASKSVATVTSTTLDVDMAAKFRLNYPEGGEFKFKSALPFKNLGAALTLGTTYTTKSGIFIMGNVKDLGFIRWGKSSYAGSFDVTATNVALVGNPGEPEETKLQRALDNAAKGNTEQKRFITPINSRADFLISKTFGAYTPSLIVTKNIFNKYGEAALVNTLKSGTFSFSAVPSYNLDKDFRLGLQGMIQTPNFEMFLGTNDILQTYYAGKDLINNNQAVETGYNRGSVYLGMAFKIGYIVEHPMNMSWMPGVGSGKERTSFFGRIFGIFKKKK
ncbi:MAG: hypothetical protein EOO47_12100 [Flavobacterium sp.]|nr:MAG: hypothetical protein EOO47_12100 [Flavobacterium sp.]